MQSYVFTLSSLPLSLHRSICNFLLSVLSLSLSLSLSFFLPPTSVLSSDQPSLPRSTGTSLSLSKSKSKEGEKEEQCNSFFMLKLRRPRSLSFSDCYSVPGTVTDFKLHLESLKIQSGFRVSRHYSEREGEEGSGNKKKMEESE